MARKTYQNWLTRTVDAALATVSPMRGIRRRQERLFYDRVMSRGGNSYRKIAQGRLDTTNQVSGASDSHLELGYDREAGYQTARDLQRNSPIASGLLDRDADNIIGDGHTPKALTEDKEWNQAAVERFAVWAEEEADVRRMAHFNELQRFAWTMHRRDGDVGTIFVDNGAIQIVPADMLAAPFGYQFGDPTMVGGIQLDPVTLAPVMFHVVTYENLDPKIYKGEPRNLPGRIEVPPEHFLFLANRLDSQQTRGISGFHSVCDLFDQLTEYLESVIVAARMAAIFGLVIYEESPGFDDAFESETASDGQDYKKWNMYPGMVKKLDANDRMEQVKSEQPSQQAEALIRMILRIIGAAWGLPLEVVLLDFSQTNYSSARASLLQAYKAWEAAQAKFQRQWLKPIWCRKIQDFIDEGSLDDNPDKFNHVWHGPGWPWLDPDKEIAADMMAVEANFTSLESVARKRGFNLIQVLRQRKAEQTLIEELGLPTVRSVKTRDPIDPNTLAQAGAPDGSPEGGGPEEPGDIPDQEGEDEGDNGGPD